MFYDILAENDDSFQHKTIKHINTLPVEVRCRTYALMSVGKQLSAVKDAHLSNVFKLQKDNEELLRKLYEERRKVVDPNGGLGGVPGFWLNCLLKNETTAPMISSRDKEALQSLRDITIEYVDNDISKGFVLNFHFDSSVYLNQQVLRKTFRQNLIHGEQYLYGIEGSKISWKSDQADLTKCKESKKRKPGARFSGKHRQTESFFNFFALRHTRDMDMDSSDVRQEEEMEYEVGLEIKNQIVPFAIDYFLGERR
ncbi:nucleosome assembly protein [Perkinsela sp. CCAP 1560/4]|nr:nucleosome assembly protein [Perkinsela sp. CCAP 1560/4]|eukprot:KNH06717.1 nucleosome assembly protein [Perkinsela sp. CCAP 1560/4]